MEQGLVMSRLAMPLMLKLTERQKIPGVMLSADHGSAFWIASIWALILMRIRPPKGRALRAAAEAGNIKTQDIKVQKPKILKTKILKTKI